jgi:hypothetical protein
MNYSWDPYKKVVVGVDPASGIIIELMPLKNESSTSPIVVERMAAVEQQKVEKRPYKKRTTGKAPPGAPSSGGKRVVRCKTCGTIGHIAKTCPNKPAGPQGLRDKIFGAYLEWGENVPTISELWTITGANTKDIEEAVAWLMREGKI